MNDNLNMDCFSSLEITQTVLIRLIDYMIFFEFLAPQSKKLNIFYLF